MIKVEHGTTEVSGLNIEIVGDLNCIIHTLLKEQAEMLFATITAWEDTLTKRMTDDDIDVAKLTLIEDLSKKFIEVMREDGKL